MPGSPRIDLGEGFIRSHDLLDALQRDITSAYQSLELDRNSQYLRRCAVRAIFSFVEAAIECVKVEVRSTVRTSNATCELSEKDKEILGSLHVIGPRQDKFFSLDQNIKRTFRLAAKVWRIPSFELNTSTEDFQDFLRAKEARNRLTHPKTFYDIEVNDFDMHCHTVAGMWVQEEFRRLFTERINSLTNGLPDADSEVILRGV